jgi:hypothetical protein
MAEHEPSIGMSSDWYTPPDYFTKFGLTFDLDPASPERRGGPAVHDHLEFCRKLHREIARLRAA